ncbi:MAG: class I SAM-dependent methyltransferase [Sediminibacterium sp.]|nr:class I SAM-dependent methyltransferase [Sediminibacterium sp.]MBP6144637.1 class I SAM-dependent methyltransferase [Sediminibacterium sp.]
MKDFWNQRYATHDTVYGKAPNQYFKSIMDSLTTGSLLLPAEGEGRNSVYAASLGWKVEAFDYSSVAQEKALQFAQTTKVTIKYDVLELNDFKATKQYDAIGLIYVHLPENERIVFHQKMIDALLPGGVLILEAFSKAQINNTSGGPKDIEQLYSLDQLKQDFASLNCIQAIEIEIDLEEGPFHKGKANLVRYCAKK